MLPLRIALRYLFSKKSHNAVNILSIISVAGVAIATAAMVIVLSVFNGFSDLAASKLSQLDPDYLIKPSAGKVIENADSLAELLQAIAGIHTASPVVTEQALVVTADAQTPITMVGMSPRGVEATNLQGVMIDGIPAVGVVDDPASELDGMNVGVLSVGTAVATGLRAGTRNVMNIFVPRRLGRINVANPMTAFMGDSMLVAGVYRVEQAEYDTDMVMVPLEMARKLLQYNDGEASALQVFVDKEVTPANIAAAIAHTLGDKYVVLDRFRQQQQAFNMIAVEKWVTMLMLAFILIITSFNIISAIYILKVEKQGNMAVLKAMGATSAMIKEIFAWQGRLITLAGGAVGLIIGAVLTLAQQYGHFIKLHAGDTSLLSVESYPVRLEGTDLLIVSGVVIIVALVCARISTISRS